MCNQGQDTLDQMLLHLESELCKVLKTATMFYQLRVRTRLVALEYPDFIVWSPNLVGITAVVDIWDRSHKALGQIIVPVPQEWADVPMW